MIQMSLFQSIPPVVTRQANGRELPERFEEFHADNPHVYAHLRRLALTQRRAGNMRGSIKQLFEVLRWQASLTTTSRDFKLDNNWHSFYARLIMKNEPELAGFFETRKGRYHD